MRGWRYALIALGVLVWVIAVFLMVEGNILGERTTGIATLLGMVGMFIILITSMYVLMLRKAEKSSKGNLNKALRAHVPAVTIRHYLLFERGE